MQAMLSALERNQCAIRRRDFEVTPSEFGRTESRLDKPAEIGPSRILGLDRCLDSKLNGAFAGESLHNPRDSGRIIRAQVEIAVSGFEGQIRPRQGGSRVVPSAAVEFVQMSQSPSLKMILDPVDTSRLSGGSDASRAENHDP